MTDGDFCHQGRDTEFAQNILDCRNLLTWPFMTLESSWWGALSDGTISLSIHPFSGGGIFWIFLKKLMCCYIVLSVKVKQRYTMPLLFYRTSEKQSYYNLANFRPHLGAFLRHYHINTKSYGQWKYEWFWKYNHVLKNETLQALNQHLIGI
jgi:hypothetical protein